MINWLSSARYWIEAVLCGAPLMRPRHALANEEGAVATEYVLLLLFIAAALVATLTLLGHDIAGMYKAVCTRIGASCLGIQTIRRGDFCPP